MPTNISYKGSARDGRVDDGSFDWRLMKVTGNRHYLRVTLTALSNVRADAQGGHLQARGATSHFGSAVRSPCAPSDRVRRAAFRPGVHGRDVLARCE
jgi:hypothetical protein